MIVFIDGVVGVDSGVDSGAISDAEEYADAGHIVDVAAADVEDIVDVC